MKRRSGHVSNSSSSSFIISKKENEDMVVMVEMDLSKCVDKVLKTREEVEAYLIESYGWGDGTLLELLEDSEYMQEIYVNMLKALENDDFIYILSGSSDDYDNPVGSYLYNNGVTGLQNVNIIEEGD